MLVISPFNGVFFGLFALFAVFLILSTAVLRNRDVRIREIALSGFMLCNILVFVVYKVYLSLDTDYYLIRLAAGYAGEAFTWWEELPLQLCNINMILIPLSLLTGSRKLRAFCTYIGPLGALMALCMPTMGFAGYSLLLPRMWGYYVTHFSVLIGGIAMITLDLYRPELREIPKAILTVAAVNFGIFLINAVLRTSGLSPYANYFFNMDPEQNPVLELFWSWIPYPFLYQLPGYLILASYMVLLTLLVNRIRMCPESDS